MRAPEEERKPPADHARKFCQRTTKKEQGNDRLHEISHKPRHRRRAQPPRIHGTRHGGRHHTCRRRQALHRKCRSRRTEARRPPEARPRRWCGHRFQRSGKIPVAGHVLHRPLLGRHAGRIRSADGCCRAGARRILGAVKGRGDLDLQDPQGRKVPQWQGTDDRRRRCDAEASYRCEVGIRRARRSRLDQGDQGRRRQSRADAQRRQCRHAAASVRLPPGHPAEWRRR